MLALERLIQKRYDDIVFPAGLTKPRGLFDMAARGEPKPYIVKYQIPGPNTQFTFRDASSGELLTIEPYMLQLNLVTNDGREKAWECMTLIDAAMLKPMNVANLSIGVRRPLPPVVAEMPRGSDGKPIHQGVARYQFDFDNLMA